MDWLTIKDCVDLLILINGWKDNILISLKDMNDFIYNVTLFFYRIWFELD